MADQVRLQVLASSTPVSPATLSYVLGAAGVRVLSLLGTCLAHPPSLHVEICLRCAGRHLAMAVGGSEHRDWIHRLALIVRLVVGMAAIVTVSRLVHRAVMQSVATEDPAA